MEIGKSKTGVLAWLGLHEKSCPGLQMVAFLVSLHGQGGLVEGRGQVSSLMFLLLRALIFTSYSHNFT